MSGTGRQKIGLFGSLGSLGSLVSLRKEVNNLKAAGLIHNATEKPTGDARQGTQQESDTAGSII